MTKKPTDFKQQMEELEQIVEWFESDEVDIDAAVEKFERAMELARGLHEHLEETQNKITEITDVAREAGLTDAIEEPSDKTTE